MMFDLRELYQQVIVDHNKAPRNFHHMQDACCHAEGFNPLCGDRLRLYLKLNDAGVIEDVSFEGSGCAISVASASLMTEHLKGKKATEAHTIFAQFHDMLTSSVTSDHSMGKLEVLAGVREFPARIKCATLCWHTLNAALAGDDAPAHTE